MGESTWEEKNVADMMEKKMAREVNSLQQTDLTQLTFSFISSSIWRVCGTRFRGRDGRKGKNQKYIMRTTLFQTINNFRLKSFIHNGFSLVLSSTEHFINLCPHTTDINQCTETIPVLVYKHRMCESTTVGGDDILYLVSIRLFSSWPIMSQTKQTTN